MGVLREFKPTFRNSFVNTKPDATVLPLYSAYKSCSIRATKSQVGYPDIRLPCLLKLP